MLTVNQAKIPKVTRGLFFSLSLSLLHFILHLSGYPVGSTFKTHTESDPLLPSLLASYFLTVLLNL